MIERISEHGTEGEYEDSEIPGQPDPHTDPVADPPGSYEDSELPADAVTPEGDADDADAR
ncbi:hypothetical protein [Homoserinibacter sp. YIM 151385]|uniref:hypothetical protein n=1 Tax=Homoserinibacter sp. YIM 151385 TaxID=2985506 RepID=UPI0022EFDF5E|nr:hypothetical protein [Homoserinibacter sp. YIM 151385]WBU37454.1 hypothetical protein OF852_11095 [Homoserinibacter sp. YIM 151385]